MNFKRVLAPLPVTALRAGSGLSVEAGSYRSTSLRAVMHDLSMMGNTTLKCAAKIGQDRTGTVEMITRLVDASRPDPLQSQGVTP
ncbi:hypothetical protein KEX41_29155 (plasmid) [Burkholderia thailandensis]|uniref:hypothetical protein n=1 Tax=Burkholderia thailandensis TaxID=57975 RepID=UPI00192E09C0|nr:hypothetical protein [Burkholderia thailandensis]MBS2132254.1 hypothetical protein [Burkholderia thailandensis]QRA15346.1 hypothetical protein JMY07_29580 [Burkholderia thailandensis]